LEEVWESLSRDIAGLPFTPEQEADLDRRLDSLDREGPVGISAEDLQKRLRGR
jgi:putative addiction module component (TIGR02574 family)